MSKAHARLLKRPSPDPHPIAILSLRWSQVDLERGLIDFEQGRRTKKRKGLIPIPPRLLPHLIRARRCGSDLGYVVHRNGKRLGDLKRAFKAACTRGRLAEVSLHVLKHTAITWSMQNNSDPWLAAGFFATSVETPVRLRASPSRLYAERRREHRAASAECPGNWQTFLICSGTFGPESDRKPMAKASVSKPPKAEITGSNPVGCANLLASISTLGASEEPPAL
jgi:hypothetical protein